MERVLITYIMTLSWRRRSTLGRQAARGLQTPRMGPPRVGREEDACRRQGAYRPCHVDRVPRWHTF